MSEFQNMNPAVDVYTNLKHPLAMEPQSEMPETMPILNTSSTSLTMINANK
jgi:hypothetical protein